MTTKTTLKSYSTPKIPVEEISRSETDVPEWFYETLVQESNELALTLTENIPSVYTDAGYILQFDRATKTDYENAIRSNPRIVIQGLVAACHMSERIVREHIGIEGVYGYGYDSVEPENTPALQQFIVEGCQEYLTYEVPVETVVHLYFRSQEQHRSHQAGEGFHSEVREFLSNFDLLVEHGQSHPGRPNFLVNKTKPIEFSKNAVVGKAIQAKSNDVPKRARHIASRLEAMKNAEPNITTAIIIKITGSEFPNDRVREKQRERIHQQHPDDVDGVFFDDELSEFASFCHENIKVFDVSPRSQNEEKTTSPSLDAWEK